MNEKDSNELVIINQPGTKTEKLPAKNMIDAQVKKEVAKIDISRQAIAALKKKYGALEISGPDDKKGYEAVDAARKDIKKKAAAVENKRKEINAGFLAITKGVNDFAKELDTPLRELQGELESKLKVIDEQVAQAELERKEAAEKLLNERITELEAAGISFNGRFYAIGDSVSIDVVTLQSFTDDDYTALLSTVKSEKKRLDEQAEAKRLADEKEKQEQELLAQQLAQQKAQQDEQQRQLDEKQAELDKMLNAAKERETLSRIEKIMSFGFAYDGLLQQPKLFINNPSGLLEITRDEIEQATPENWETILLDFKTKAAEIKVKEAARLEVELEKTNLIATRDAQLYTLNFYQITGGYRFENKVTGYNYTIIDHSVQNLTADEWEKELINVKAFIADQEQGAAKLIADQEKQKEKDRKEALNDSQKINEYLTALRIIRAEKPTLKSKPLVSALADFENAVSDALACFEEALEKQSK